MEEYKTLEEYLGKKERELTALQREVKFLRGIKIPLNIYNQGGELYFTSDNYSLATGFDIRTRNENLGSGKNLEGIWSRDKISYYPAFYFQISRRPQKPIKVHVEYTDYKKDETFIIRQLERGTGLKKYSDKNYVKENWVDTEKVIIFFKDKKVKPKLLKKLINTIKFAGEIGNDL